MSKLDQALSVNEAARELLRLLDEALPHIESAITIASIHGCPYGGPRCDLAMNALRRALDLSGGGES